MAIGLGLIVHSHPPPSQEGGHKDARTTNAEKSLARPSEELEITQRQLIATAETSIRSRLLHFHVFDSARNPIEAATIMVTKSPPGRALPPGEVMVLGKTDKCGELRLEDPAAKQIAEFTYAAVRDNCSSRFICKSATAEVSKFEATLVSDPSQLVLRLRDLCGAPIQGIEVLVSQAQLPAAIARRGLHSDCAAFAQPGHQIRHATSDSNGIVEIANLPNGEYHFAIVGNGWITVNGPDCMIERLATGKGVYDVTLDRLFVMALYVKHDTILAHSVESKTQLFRHYMVRQMGHYLDQIREKHPHCQIVSGFMRPSAKVISMSAHVILHLSRSGQVILDVPLVPYSVDVEPEVFEASSGACVTTPGTVCISVSDVRGKAIPDIPVRLFALTSSRLILDCKTGTITQVPPGDYRIQVADECASIRPVQGGSWMFKVNPGQQLEVPLVCDKELHKVVLDMEVASASARDVGHYIIYFRSQVSGAMAINGDGWLKRTLWLTAGIYDVTGDMPGFSLLPQSISVDCDKDCLLHAIGND